MDLFSGLGDTEEGCVVLKILVASRPVPRIGSTLGKHTSINGSIDHTRAASSLLFQVEDYYHYCAQAKQEVKLTLFKLPATACPTDSNDRKNSIDRWGRVGSNRNGNIDHTSRAALRAIV